MGAHLALATLIGVALWIHLARLNRPTWFPHRRWLIGLTIVVLGVSIVAPLGMLPKAQLDRVPTSFPIDLTYLFYLPLAFSPTFNTAWVWLGMLVLLVGVGALPWIPSPRQPVPLRVIDGKCTGCTVCANECPYKAITLEPRTDGRPHKFVALAHPERCVACGICVGACEGGAIALDNLSTDVLSQVIAARLATARDKEVILTCARQARHSTLTHANLFVLPCVGVVGADLMGRIIEAGAQEVRVVGCLPEDCAHREGNTWLEKRLTSKRVARQRKIGTHNVRLDWVPIGELANVATGARAGTSHRWPELEWRHFVLAFGLLAIVLLAQIGLMNVTFQP